MKRPKHEVNIEPLAELRAVIQKFIQEISIHSAPIQDMSITITTPKGTISVKMSQEMKSAGD